MKTEQINMECFVFSNFCVFILFMIKINFIISLLFTRCCDENTIDFAHYNFVIKIYFASLSKINK